MLPSLSHSNPELYLWLEFLLQFFAFSGMGSISPWGAANPSKHGNGPSPLPNLPRSLIGVILEAAGRHLVVKANFPFPFLSEERRGAAEAF